MNTRHRRKRLYPAEEQSKRDEYFRDIGLLKMDEKRLRQKRNFELWCEGRDKEMTSTTPPLRKGPERGPG